MKRFLVTGFSSLVLAAGFLPCRADAEPIRLRGSLQVRERSIVEDVNMLQLRDINNAVVFQVDDQGNLTFSGTCSTCPGASGDSGDFTSITVHSTGAAQDLLISTLGDSGNGVANVIVQQAGDNSSVISTTYNAALDTFGVFRVKPTVTTVEFQGAAAVTFAPETTTFANDHHIVVGTGGEIFDDGFNGISIYSPSEVAPEQYIRLLSGGGGAALMGVVGGASFAVTGGVFGQIQMVGPSGSSSDSSFTIEQDGTFRIRTSGAGLPDIIFDGPLFDWTFDNATGSFDTTSVITNTFREKTAGGTIFDFRDSTDSSFLTLTRSGPSAIYNVNTSGAHSFQANNVQLLNVFAAGTAATARFDGDPYTFLSGDSTVGIIYGALSHIFQNAGGTLLTVDETVDTVTRLSTPAAQALQVIAATTFEARSATDTFLEADNGSGNAALHVTATGLNGNAFVTVAEDGDSSVVNINANDTAGNGSAILVQALTNGDGIHYQTDTGGLHVWDIGGAQAWKMSAAAGSSTLEANGDANETFVNGVFGWQYNTDWAKTHKFNIGGKTLLSIETDRIIVGAQVEYDDQLATVLDNGDGTAANFTLIPTSSYVNIRCNDPDGCNGSIATGAGRDLLITIDSASTGSVTFADNATAGFELKVAGASITLTTYDVVRFFGQVDSGIDYWVQASPVVNND